MKCVRITPSKLIGEISIPPSKSMSHRMLICASLAEGESILRNIAFSDDITATVNAVKALGARVRYLADSIDRKANDVVVTGNKFPEIKEDVIDCIESASTLRFLIPVASVAGKQVTFTGRGKLMQRPVDIFCRIFEQQNINCNTNNQGLPLTFSGKLKPGEFHVRGDVSSQFISGLLFALPLLEGDSKIIITTPMESKGYIVLTIDALEKHSVTVENRGFEQFLIRGHQRYKPANHRIEGDFSQGAFWLVAGILGGDITCLSLDMDSLQGDKNIVDIICKMGAKSVIGRDFIKTKTSNTFGVTVDASQCPDLVPAIAVLGALSHGKTRIINAGRLRIKESDRLKAISSELAKLGAKVAELHDGLVIEGQNILNGGIVDSWNDHRIAMALAVAATRCSEPVVIKNSNAVNKSYPGFWKDFAKVGGVISEFNLRE